MAAHTEYTEPAAHHGMRKAARTETSQRLAERNRDFLGCIKFNGGMKNEKDFSGCDFVLCPAECRQCSTVQKQADHIFHGLGDHCKWIRR
jgi:hypothetical protein